MLTIWGRASSVNVQKVTWAAAELGLETERHDVGGPFGGNHAPEFLAMNPHGLVPAVRFSDGVTMWESNAVVRALALRDQARRLWPAGGQGAADADMWAEWARVGAERHILGLFSAVVRVRPAERDLAAIAAHEAACHAALGSAERQLGRGQWLAGDALSIADIAFGATLYRYFTMEVERPALPAVEAYYARLVERPAYAEHVMIDYAWMRPKP